MRLKLTTGPGGIGLIVVDEGLVGGIEVYQNDGHDERREDAPAESPVETNLAAQHELNVLAETICAVDPANGVELSDSQDQGNHGRTKEVHQREHILTTLWEDSSSLEIDLSIVFLISYWRYVHQTNEEANDCDEERALPLLEVGETISDGSHRTGSHRYIGPNAEDEQHEEEHDREDLRQLLELCNGIGIRDESQTSSSLHHTANVIGADFMCQMSQDAKDREAGEEGGRRIQGSHNRGIPMDVVAKFVEGRIHDYVAKANGEGVEALSDSRIPDLRIQNLLPVGLNEVVDAIQRSRQGYGSNQENAHDDIRKQGEEVGGLSRALNSSTNDEEDA